MAKNTRHDTYPKRSALQGTYMLHDFQDQHFLQIYLAPSAVEHEQLDVALRFRLRVTLPPLPSNKTSILSLFIL